MVSDIAQAIHRFQNKMKLFQKDIKTKSLQHFPLLKGLLNSLNDLFTEMIKAYVERLYAVSTNFATRFSDLLNLRPSFAYWLRNRC